MQIIIMGLFLGKYGLQYLSVNLLEMRFRWLKNLIMQTYLFSKDTNCEIVGNG